MEDDLIHNQNRKNNDLGKSCFESTKIKKSFTKVNDKIKNKQLEGEEIQDIFESNELKTNGNSYGGENSQNKENEMNNSQDNNSKLPSKNRILNEPLNININYNKIYLEQIKPKPLHKYLTNKKLTEDNRLFLNDKRVLTSMKSHKTNIIFNCTRKRILNSKNIRTYNDFFKSENINLKSNYAPTYSNTKVVKLKKGPRDEISCNIKKNLNLYFSSLENKHSNSIILYKTNTHLNQTKFITKVKKLPNKKIEENHFNEIKASKNSDLLKEKKETKKDFEFNNGDKTLDYLSLRNPLFLNDLNCELKQSNINELDSNWINNSENNYTEDKYLKEREKYQEIDLSKNKNIFIKSNSTPIEDEAINFSSGLIKCLSVTNNNNEKKTFVKKLPPLEKTFNIDKATSGLSDKEEISHHIIKTIPNNLEGHNKLSNKPNITVKKLSNKGLTKEINKNVLKNINENEKILSDIKSKENDRKTFIINNPINNPNQELSHQNKTAIISHENNIQMLEKGNNPNIHIYNIFSQPNNIYHQNQQKPFQSYNIENKNEELFIQDNINLRELAISPVEENNNNFISNDLNQNINANNFSFPNYYHLDDYKENRLNINEIFENQGEEKETNETFQNIDEIKEVIEDNFLNKVLYNDFDSTRFIKNYGGVSRPGKDITGRRKINQDSFVILTNINNIKNFNIFGVLDGHGTQGHFVSQFASKYIPSQIFNNAEIKNLSQPEKIYEKLKNNNYLIIKEAFLTCDEKLKTVEFDAYSSGSTCVLIIHIGNHIICSNAGDSRAVVAYDEKGDPGLNYLNSAALSFDYKPEITEEKNRILMSGGEVRKMKNEYGFSIGPYRVYIQGTNFPGLAMSRSIGDLKAKTVGVIPLPGIMEYNLNSFIKYIIICSDGVWDHLSNELVKDIGRNFYLENKPSQFCHQLVNDSVIEWQKKDNVIDDITAVVIFF